MDTVNKQGCSQRCLLDHHSIDKLLSEFRIRKKVSERDVVTVRKETNGFLVTAVTAVTRLLVKWLLRYTLVRSLSWLDSQKIKEKQDPTFEKQN